MNMDILSKLVITKVYSASTMYNPKSAKTKRNKRQNWAIVIKYEGETLYSSNGKCFTSDLNHIAMLPKGCVYDWKCTKPGHFCIVEFESEPIFFEPIIFSLRHGEKILKLFRELEYKMTLKNSMSEIESIKCVYSIILNLVGANSERYIPNYKQQKLQPAIEYITQNYSKHIKNDNLAALCGISTVYFRKLFCEVMGVSPIAYARQLRIEKAKEMLDSDYGAL